MWKCCHTISAAQRESSSKPTRSLAVSENLLIARSLLSSDFIGSSIRFLWIRLLLLYEEVWKQT